MKHIFNLRKDKSDTRDHLAMRSLAKLPSSVMAGANLGPVRDQGNSGSCTGQAGAGFMDWLYLAMRQYFPDKTLTDVEFSALFLYAEERMKDGSFPQDYGSDSRTLFRVLNQVGICTNALDPFVDTALGEHPTDAMIAAAAQFKVGAYHRILYDAGVMTAKSVLASGYCFTMGIPVYQALESDEVAATGLLPVPAATDTSIGGHELLVYGYDDERTVGTHVGALKVRNSWGKSWGLSGNLHIPYDYFAAVGGNDTCDAWVGHMGKPWTVAK